jgi:hypothetical protein
MKIIQTLNDIEQLRAIKAVPMELIEMIEQDFINLYEAEGLDANLLMFCLPYQQALFLLEAGDDVLVLLNDLFTLEYVEKDKRGGIEFYRIAKRLEHEFQLIYTLVGIHNKEIENWLQEQADWNEGVGGFNV